jgi:hypothetical protein
MNSAADSESSNIWIFLGGLPPPASFLSNGYQLFPTSAKVKDPWSFTSTPLICLHGAVFRHRDNFTLETTTATKLSQCERTFTCCDEKLSQCERTFTCYDEIVSVWTHLHVLWRKIISVWTHLHALRRKIVSVWTHLQVLRRNYLSVNAPSRTKSKANRREQCWPPEDIWRAAAGQQVDGSGQGRRGWEPHPPGTSLVLCSPRGLQTAVRGAEQMSPSELADALRIQLQITILDFYCCLEVVTVAF